MNRVWRTGRKIRKTVHVREMVASKMCNKRSNGKGITHHNDMNYSMFY